MKITVNVTEENITKGKACSSGRCPVALALLDTGFISVRVGDGYSVSASSYKTGAAFSKGAVNLSHYITDTQKQRIDKFIGNFDDSDTRKKAKPFKFTMNVPDDVLKAVKFQKPEVAA